MMKNRILPLILILFSIGQFILAQSISSYDLKNIKVDQLTDAQVSAFVKNAEEKGMTLEQLEALAITRGMPASEIQKLKNRIEKIQSRKTDTRREEESGREYDFAPKEEDMFINLFGEDMARDTSKMRQLHKIYGYSLFNNKNLTFEPSLNIPTPKNYQIGPGDEILINVWGASQQDYILEVSPEGKIYINDLGPIYVNGLTIEKATNKIKYRLQAIYSGLAGEKPNTYAQVGLGKLRSIKVNVTGEAFMPGTYTLPSLATAFNALYYAGGPGINGSFRNIQIIRDNENVANIDLYEFLVYGTSEGNILLRDQDVVFIPPFITRVEVEGEVKRPGIYEMKEKETFSNLVDFTGNFNKNAYKKNIKLIRNTETEKEILDISQEKWNTTVLKNGDKIVVDQLIERFANRVEIRGAVYRPGPYELVNGMTVKGLIEKADGIKEDAFTERAMIYRLQPNNKTEVVSIDLNALLSGDVEDVPLQREDIVSIFSIFDLEEEFTVSIKGEVQYPGTYPFHNKLKLGEILATSGGLKESASLAKIDIARRIKEKNSLKPGNEIAKVFTFSISERLKVTDSAHQFQLKPYDVVFVRKSPGYEEQKFVNISGEVSFPGSYSLTSKDDRISDLIKKAGGFTDEAYLEGSKLRRRINVQDKERLRALQSIQSESEDSVEFNITTETEQSIGIDLVKIINNPKSKFDLLLQEGDILIVPKQLQTVSMNGAFLYPIIARYDKTYRFKKYVNQAGGFAQDAKRNKTYVIYANGSVKRTHSLLGINFFPGIEPGAEIIVPRKEEKKKISVQEMVSLGSIVTSMSMVVVTTINVINNSGNSGQ